MKLLATTVTMGVLMLAWAGAAIAKSWFITAYCLGGTTATGYPVGPGVVAVDPGTIPLGAHVYVDGQHYRARDTGGAVRGQHIDVWLSSCSAALRFTHYTTRVWWHR